MESGVHEEPAIKKKVKENSNPTNGIPLSSQALCHTSSQLRFPRSPVTCITPTTYWGSLFTPVPILASGDSSSFLTRLLTADCSEPLLESCVCCFCSAPLLGFSPYLSVLHGLGLNHRPLPISDHVSPLRSHPAPTCATTAPEHACHRVLSASLLSTSYLKMASRKGSLLEHHPFQSPSSRLPFWRQSQMHYLKLFPVLCRREVGAICVT